MIHGSIAAGCDNTSKTFFNSMSRKRFRLPGMRADPDRPTSYD
jgi:hypothetical protein